MCRFFDILLEIIGKLISIKNIYDLNEFIKKKDCTFYVHGGAPKGYLNVKDTF